MSITPESSAPNRIAFTVGNSTPAVPVVIPPGNIWAKRDPAPAPCSRCPVHEARAQRAEEAVAVLTEKLEYSQGRVAELAATLEVATGATVEVRQTATVKRLQEIDARQRRDLAWTHRDVADLTKERDALRAACEKAKVDTSKIPAHTVRGPRVSQDGE